MALCTLPTYEIARPPLEAPLHGLLDTAYLPDLSDLPEDEQKRWEAGISFAPLPMSCEDHVTPWMSGTDDPQDKAEPGTNVPYSEYHSFVLTYSTICHVVPGRSIDDLVEGAKRALEVGTGQAVEAILWGGNPDSPIADLYPPTGTNFSLSGSTPIVTGSGAGACSGILNQNGLGGGAVAVTPKQALLALTQALGNCSVGARGFIHAPVYLAEDWAEQGLAKPSDPSDSASKLITNVRGDYVVGGSGYTGVGPYGHALETPADGNVWAYASGPIGVLLSEPEFQNTTLIDQATNLHRVIVERTVAIAANSSCLFAVYVDVA